MSNGLIVDTPHRKPVDTIVPVLVEDMAAEPQVAVTRVKLIVCRTTSPIATVAVVTEKCRKTGTVALSDWDALSPFPPNLFHKSNLW